MVTQDRLKELLYYHPKSGDFVWISKPKCQVQIGEQAGCLYANGYINIGIDGRILGAHRLAVLYMTGKWPKRIVDHEDMVRHNNVWGNLRRASYPQNGRNRSPPKSNKSGIKNIFWRADQQRFHVNLRVRGKTRHFGSFKELPDAIAVCAQAMLAFHRDFARAA